MATALKVHGQMQEHALKPGHLMIATATADAPLTASMLL
jgi:hypothetical protein